MRTATGMNEGDEVGAMEDSAPLLGSGREPERGSRSESRTRRRAKVEASGTASLLSSVANISNTILGTGMLAMAHGFATGGLIPGLLTVIFCGATAYLGLLFLARCAAHPDLEPRSASFAALSALTYPSAGVFFDAAIAIKCFGVSISYLIIFGALMPRVVKSFQHLGGGPPPEVLLDRRFWITMSMFFLVPLSFLRRLDSLRYTSYVALVAVADFVVVVVYKFIDRSGLDPPGDIHLVHVTPAFVAALPVYIFAYTCAQNLFAVYNELASNTERRVDTVLATSIGSAAGIYEVIGLLGYLTFGSNVSANLITDYHNSVFIAICRLAISVLVLFSYPLQVHPCRLSLDKVFEYRPVRPDKDDAPSSPPSQGGQREIPLPKFVAMTSCILLASFIIAVNVERLETVLGFVGSTGSTTISFILPSLFYLAMFPPPSPSTSPAAGTGPTSSRKMRFLAWALLIWGCAVFVVCLTLNTIEAVRPGLISKMSLVSAGRRILGSGGASRR